MHLAYEDRYDYHRIHTITYAIKNALECFRYNNSTLQFSINNFIEEFFEYLSNTDVTWGSYKTVTLLEISEFKMHFKNFLIIKNKKISFIQTWKTILIYIGGTKSKYVIIE